MKKKETFSITLATLWLLFSLPVSAEELPEAEPIQSGAGALATENWDSYENNEAVILYQDGTLWVEEYENKTAQLEEQYQAKVKELEPKFIDTLTDIYEHIFQISLKNSRELVVHLISNTMRNIEGNSGYLIHVSKDDYPFVSMQKKDLVENLQKDIKSIVKRATTYT